MKMKKIRPILSSLTLCSLWLATISVNAAPVRFSQVVQVVNAKPGRAGTGSFTQLRLVNDASTATGDDDDDKKKAAAPQDGRVIVETRSDIIEDDACDCLQPPVGGGGFPKYALLGLGAIPFLFLINRGKDAATPTPTNTPPTTPTNTPTSTPTNTPTNTPTPTPTTPPMTPTPEPVPEPVTILLFGTGLAGIGIAARKRLRRKDGSEETETED